MKHLAKIFLLCAVFVAVPLLAMAQTYNMVIIKADGEKVVIKTEDVQKVEFEELINKTQLEMPTVSYTKVSADAVRVTWYPVTNAEKYGYLFDGQTTPTETTNLSVDLNYLKAGDHTFKVKAMSSDKKFSDSEYATVNFTTEAVATQGVAMKMILEGLSHDRVRVIFTPEEKAQFTVAVVPASAASSDDAILAYVKNLPADQKTTEVFDVQTYVIWHGSGLQTEFTEKTYTGLTPETEYFIVAVSGDDKVYTKKFTTDKLLSQGSKGTIFPRGVSLSGGFVDVDKLGRDAPYCGLDGKYKDTPCYLYKKDAQGVMVDIKNEKGDTPLCWACVASGMLQWWLNDYEVSTGHAFQLAYPLPNTNYYTTPIMDVLMMGVSVHDSGVPAWAFRWFMQGFNKVGSFSLHGNDGDYTLNEKWEYGHGGFGGFKQSDVNPYNREEFTDLYIYDQDRITGFYSKTSADESADKFSEIFLGCLRNGPIYISVDGTHALCVWGAEYEIIDSNGKKRISRLYIAENDPVAGNTRNGLESSKVEFKLRNGAYFPYVNLPSFATGAKWIGPFTNLRSWESVNGK